MEAKMVVVLVVRFDSPTAVTMNINAVCICHMHWQSNAVVA
jgi:hypothetical protein